MVGPPRYARVSLALALLSIVVPAHAQQTPAPEEIPIERCDRLPVVRVRVDGLEKRFLVDTAATTLLNLHSFPKGKAKDAQISSWRGTSTTRAHEIILGELVLGSYRARNLKLFAVDLSPIEKACGGRIDGILGVDLLERMGAILDLKRRVAMLPGKPVNASEQARRDEYENFAATCIDAFNRADSAGLGKCFDPDILHYTPMAEIQGRQHVMDLYDQNFFHVDPPAQIHVEIKAQSVLPDMAWSAFVYSITLPDRTIRARATMMSRKLNGKWVIVSLHESLIQP